MSTPVSPLVIKSGGRNSRAGDWDARRREGGDGHRHDDAHHRLKDGDLLAPRMFIRNRMVSTATGDECGSAQHQGQQILVNEMTYMAMPRPVDVDQVKMPARR